MFFKPPAIFAGQSSTAHVLAVNCTNRTLNTTLTWFGHFARGGGLPPGCPVIDPLPEGETFAPLGKVSAHVTYLVPATCTATSLVITAEFSAAGVVLAERSATLTITPPPA
jgi:hypothetical protein